MGALAASDFAIPASGGPVRVIELVPDQLLTGSAVESPRMVGRARGGGPRAATWRRSPSSSATTRAGGSGCGFVRGFGLREGAFASTVSHDAHNLIVVGVSDDDMGLCVRRLAELGGGIVVVRDGAVLGRAGPAGRPG